VKVGNDHAKRKESGPIDRNYSFFFTNHQSPPLSFPYLHTPVHTINKIINNNKYIIVMPSSLSKKFVVMAMGDNNNNKYGNGESGSTNPPSGVIPTMWYHFHELFFSHNDEEWTILKQRLTDEIIHPIDLTFLIVMSSLSYFIVNNNNNKQPQQQKGEGVAKYSSLSYFDLFLVHVSQLARISLVIYVIDCVVVIWETLGVVVWDQHQHINSDDSAADVDGLLMSSPSLHVWSAGLAKILYIGWTAQRFSAFKRYGLNKIFLRRRKVDDRTSSNASSTHGSDGSNGGKETDTIIDEIEEEDKSGRVLAIDRLVDGGIIACTFFITLDVLNVDLGMSGVTSIFAFSSAGTLVVGLASQHLATMFVNGLLLTTSDRIKEGDFIQFKNTCGQIMKIGWFQTTLRHFDELIEVIPNSELGMLSVTNLSRAKRCRVRQTLRFPYDAVDKLDVVLPDILEEIKASCPKVISDGTAALRAVWTDYKEDHIRIMVEAHFNLPPLGSVYWNNRHVCLQAIHRACKKHDIQLVVGLYPNGINN
jgi:small-conductance mechanosensitive channel